MIKKHTFGMPFNTEAIIIDFAPAADALPYFEVEKSNSLILSYQMEDNDLVFGLGESVRGINKRGWHYESMAEDDNLHTETRTALYCAHNFFIVHGDKSFGVFIDYPGYIHFDIGFKRKDIIEITIKESDCDIYIIDGNSDKEIVKEFRKSIGQSYIPPRWAFGYQQSRWGYKTENDIRTVVAEHKKNHIPLDVVYLDIDYMERYKDFTVDKNNFPNFAKLVADMKKEHIHLVPIIDGGVKIEEGYEIYEEGVKSNYFCKRKDGSDFIAGVWPGDTHFPDFLNPTAREWFGEKYKFLTDMGIDGFWNDMNEPAIFYTAESLKDKFDYLKNTSLDNLSNKEMDDILCKLAQKDTKKDYELFYHNIDGKSVVHSNLHNIYGYNMTRAAGEAFEKICPDKRILLFSRSSYIGMHRYGGMWTGDNHAWWSHLLLNIKMMPSLNMCGFLYAGADIGGFSGDTTRDLLLRWLAFGVFTPLMRNHTEVQCWNEEVYQFENINDFIQIISVRYALIPYVYSEFVKASFNNDMYFRPLAFDYPEDKLALHTEDQLMLGESVMIAPVYEQNAIGRNVYLPEEMLMVKFIGADSKEFSMLTKGYHFIEIALNEIVIFIKKNNFIPLCKYKENTESLDFSSLELIGTVENIAEYIFYCDDGISKCFNNANNFTTIKVNTSKNEIKVSNADINCINNLTEM